MPAVRQSLLSLLFNEKPRLVKLSTTHQHHRSSKPPLPLAGSRMNLRRYLILAIVTLTSALGDTFLAVGMKGLGPVSLHHLSTLVVALKVPWVLAGIALLIGFFASYLTALSWADVTFVLPATSFAYVVVALLSRFWLHEQITPARWLGIFCIVAGVGFVTRGPAYTEHAASDETAEPASQACVPISGTVAQQGVKH